MPRTEIVWRVLESTRHFIVRAHPRCQDSMLHAVNVELFQVSSESAHETRFVLAHPNVCQVALSAGVGFVDSMVSEERYVSGSICAVYGKLGMRPQRGQRSNNRPLEVHAEHVVARLSICRSGLSCARTTVASSATSSHMLRVRCMYVSTF